MTTAIVKGSEPRRFRNLSARKATGQTYTPTNLSDFVADQILANFSVSRTPIRILDPGVGDGQLLMSLISKIYGKFGNETQVEVHGFEVDDRANSIAQARLKKSFPECFISLQHGDFLHTVSESFDKWGKGSLFEPLKPPGFDLVIANPPYVRTQIMGADAAQKLASIFGLKGRVDLYYAFLLGISHVLEPNGVAGIIVSNRFMTTKSGASVRQALIEQLDMIHIWDLGDTKLFDAAVLPAVLIARNPGSAARDGHRRPKFSSIYQTNDSAQSHALDPIDGLNNEGVVEMDSGAKFRITHGELNVGRLNLSDIWRVSNRSTDEWLKTVAAHSWGSFRDIGRIRVGVKTCADKVFIRADWHEMPDFQRPELLRPLTTHHVAGSFRPKGGVISKQVLYPHETKNGKRTAVNLDDYPLALGYLEKHRATLEARDYVLAAGRHWYELWVPHDPQMWSGPKLVFRDISEEPTFWIDTQGTVVNGDCYWLVPDADEKLDLLWLAVAIANSEFAASFYDHKLNNKLYAGRRRFMTQYVEQFPLPDPVSALGKEMISLSKEIFYSEADHLRTRLNELVWHAFGLSVEKIVR